MASFALSSSSSTDTADSSFLSSYVSEDPKEFSSSSYPSRLIRKKRRLVNKLTSQNLLKQSNPSSSIHQEYSNLAFFSCPAAISGVAFLDGENKSILSTDSSGKIIIHRRNREDERGFTKLLELSPLSQASLKLYPLSSSALDTNNNDDASGICHSFCVGLPNGDFRVYSTEKERWSDGASQLAPHYHKCYNLYGHHQRGSRRRFYRDNIRSLYDTFNKNNQRHHIPPSLQQDYFNEILDWETKPWMIRPSFFDWNTEESLQQRTSSNLTRFYPGNGTESLWDFREVGPSLLMAAFVDTERDCFTIMDRRATRPVVYCNNLTSSPNGNADVSRLSEDITAVCFASDYCVATSHTWKVNDGTENAIKLWDIRMPSEEMVDYILPSFPYDTISRSQHGKQWYVGGHGKITKDPCCKGEIGSRHINNLSSSRHTNAIMITLQSNCGVTGTESILFDPVREKVIFKHSTQRSTSGSRIKNMDLPVVSVSHDQAHIAISETMNETGRTRISFYDPTIDNDHCGNRQRKRNVADMEEQLTTRKHPGHIGTINPILEDGDGIRTRLTSLAWNRDGTSLAGGSSDGDIFIWDGSTH